MIAIEEERVEAAAAPDRRGAAGARGRDAGREDNYNMLYQCI